jgi:hypothetical protein
MLKRAVMSFFSHLVPVGCAVGVLEEPPPSVLWTKINCGSVEIIQAGVPLDNMR